MNVVMIRSVVVTDSVSCFQVWAGWVEFSFLLTGIIVTQAKKRITTTPLLYKYNISQPLSNTNCWLATSHVMVLNHWLQNINLLLTEYNFCSELTSTIKLDRTCIWWYNCCGKKQIIMQTFSVILGKVLKFLIYIFSKNSWIWKWFTHV